MRHNIGDEILAQPLRLMTTSAVRRHVFKLAGAYEFHHRFRPKVETKCYVAHGRAKSGRRKIK